MNSTKLQNSAKLEEIVEGIAARRRRCLWGRRRRERNRSLLLLWLILLLLRLVLLVLVLLRKGIGLLKLLQLRLLLRREGGSGGRGRRCWSNLRTLRERGRGLGHHVEAKVHAHVREELRLLGLLRRGGRDRSSRPRSGSCDRPGSRQALRRGHVRMTRHGPGRVALGRGVRRSIRRVAWHRARVALGGHWVAIGSRLRGVAVRPGLGRVGAVGTWLGRVLARL